MNERTGDCRDFRRALERALEGRARPDELAPLAWHEHLLSCADCRALLEREEALEDLLASWPDPRLSPPRRRALLASLRAEAHGDEALDALLDRDRGIVAPEGLAHSVRARVGDARLEALLDLDRDAGVEVPADLAARVRAALARERAPARRIIDRRWAWPAAAAAAAVVIALALPRGDDVERAELAQRPEGSADGAAQPVVATDDGRPGDAARADPLSASEHDELLAVLDLLEEDALWAEESLDLALAAEIDVEAEWLLEEGMRENADDAPRGAGGAADRSGGDDAEGEDS